MVFFYQPVLYPPPPQLASSTDFSSSPQPQLWLGIFMSSSCFWPSPPQSPCSSGHTLLCSFWSNSNRYRKTLQYSWDWPLCSDLPLCMANSIWLMIVRVIMWHGCVRMFLRLFKNLQETFGCPQYSSCVLSDDQRSISSLDYSWGESSLFFLSLRLEVAVSCRIVLSCQEDKGKGFCFSLF